MTKLPSIRGKFIFQFTKESGTKIVIKADTLVGQSIDRVKNFYSNHIWTKYETKKANHEFVAAKFTYMNSYLCQKIIYEMCEWLEKGESKRFMLFVDQMFDLKTGGQYKSLKDLEYYRGAYRFYDNSLRKNQGSKEDFERA